MATSMKTIALLISMTCLMTACGEESSNQAPSTTAPDAHAGHDHSGHDHDSHMEKAGDTADKAASDAEALLEAVTKHINDNKLDLAEKALAELEAMKADLPESLQDKIAAAKTAIEAAKAAAGKMEMPAMPKLDE